MIRQYQRQNTALAKRLIPNYRDAIKLYAIQRAQATKILRNLRQRVCKPQKVSLKSYFEAIEFNSEESNDIEKKQKKVKKVQLQRY
jgi:hypothetical protein